RGVVTFPSFYFTIIPPILSASRRREAVSCSEHVERRPRRLARQGRRGREEAGWSICSTTYRGPRRGSFSSPWCSSWRGPGGTPGSCSTFSRSSCSGTLLVFALLGNLLEELLFRGYVYNNFRTKDVDLRAGVICGIVGAKYGVLPAAVVHGGAIFMFTSGIMNVCFRGVIPFASAFGRIPTASSTRTRSSCRSNCSDRMWPMTRSHSGFTRRLTAIDFRAAAPGEATYEAYPDGVPSRGCGAVAVPGTVAGLALALERYGTMTWEQVSRPAIRLAEEGFVVTETLEGVILDSYTTLLEDPELSSVYLKDGLPPMAGDVLRNENLAYTLRVLAEQGPRAFYEGEIAERIVAAVRAGGGLLSLEDMKSYTAIEREPARGTYRGYEILGAPPPVGGGVSVVNALQQLEHFDLSAGA